MAFARRVSRCAADPFRIRATRAARSGGERKPARIMLRDESISHSSATNFFAVSMSRGVASKRRSRHPQKFGKDLQIQYNTVVSPRSRIQAAVKIGWRLRLVNARF